MWPIETPKDYLAFVNIPMNEKEKELIQYSINRGKPFGADAWSTAMIEKYGLGATVRKRGRQIKGTSEPLCSLIPSFANSASCATLTK